MIRKAVEWLLIAVVLVGGVLAWRTGRERSRLGAEYARLARAAGDLTIVDPTRIHILAVDTGEPLHYAWRVYLPTNCKRTLQSNLGNMTFISAGRPEEFIARLRIRQEPGKDPLQVYQQFEFSRMRSDLGDGRLANILRGREGEIQVEQLGKGGVAVLDPDRSAVLLRLAIPAQMQAKARETLDRATLDRFLPDLIRYELDPEPTRPKAATPGS